VIVISKDDPQGLADTLNSIREQSFRDFEVVVVAKGRSAAAASGGELPALVVVEQAGNGISDAFNLGLSRARGRWINFLNGGDRYAGADSLATAAQAMQTGVAVVSALAVDAKTGVQIPRARSFAARDLELVSHQASFFDAALFERHGHYSPTFRIRMDFEWMLRLPRDTRTAWLDTRLVAFEGNGISTVRPLRSSVEELRALKAHGKGAGRMLSLLCLYVPWRLARHGWRRMTIHRYGELGSR